jgi:hypothetical protein
MVPGRVNIGAKRGGRMHGEHLRRPVLRSDGSCLQGCRRYSAIFRRGRRGRGDDEASVLSQQVGQMGTRHVTCLAGAPASLPVGWIALGAPDEILKCGTSEIFCADALIRRLGGFSGASGDALKFILSCFLVLTPSVHINYWQTVLVCQQVLYCGTKGSHKDKLTSQFMVSQGTGTIQKPAKFTYKFAQILSLSHGL